MNVYTYHKDIGFPTNLRRPAGEHSLSHTRHSREAAQNDRYGPFYWLPTLMNLPASNSRSDIKLIECDALADGTVLKAVYRMPYDRERDLCLVLLFDRGPGQALVKTVWGNLATDTHKTLDASKYDRPRR